MRTPCAVAFLALASVAIGHQMATLRWADLAPLLRSYRWPQVGLAIDLTAVSFLLLGAIEILALGRCQPAARGASRDATLSSRRSFRMRSASPWESPC